MRALLEYQRRRGASEPKPLAPYLESLHPVQATALSDESREKAYLCGRRAGKTHLLACELFKTAEENPGETSLYIALTKGTARRTMGNALMRLRREGRIQGGLTELDGQLFFKHPNGHKIWLAGCKHVTEAEKFRGDFYCRVVIDEGASFAPGLLEYLIDDVLHWALVDKRAPLVIAGTPGVIPKGLFHEVTTGDGKRAMWSTHSWTMRDNPTIQDPDHELERVCKARGETLDSPSVQREFFHQWIKDESALIYPCVPSRNYFWLQGEVLGGATREFDPGLEWYYVLSLDLGWNDDTTFTVSASRRGLPHVWYLESYGRPEMTISTQCSEIMRIRQRYPIKRIVADAGGLGLSIIKSWQERGVSAEPAEKRDKAVNARMLADGLRAGTVYVHPNNCEQLVGEWAVLPWNEDRTDHHPQYADHCSDGALYGKRAHPTYERWDKEPPTPGTVEALNAEADAYRARITAEIRKQQNKRARKQLRLR